LGTLRLGRAVAARALVAAHGTATSGLNRLLGPHLDSGVGLGLRAVGLAARLAAGGEDHERDDPQARRDVPEGTDEHEAADLMDIDGCIST
jgi:hypothetical protein